MSKKKAKPQTGVKADSSIVSMLDKLSSSESPEGMPKLPEPLFDKMMGKGFEAKAKKAKKKY